MSESLPMPDAPRRGKIGRLPLAIREQLNRRLLENQLRKTIAAWINGLSEVKALLATFNDGNPAGPIDERNLSDWYLGGYQDWLKRRERLERTKELAKYAAGQAKAGAGSIAEGAAAIASGQILEVLEAVDDASGQRLPADALVKIAGAVAVLRGSDQAEERLRIEREKLKRKDQEIELDRQRFQRQTCELFLKWYQDRRAVDAIAAGGDNSAMINRLGQLMFPEDWKSISPA